MKKSLLQTLAATAMTAALGLTLMGAPAQAASRPVDVTKYTISDVTYTKGQLGCTQTPVKATIKKSSAYKYYSVQAPVTRNGKLLTTLFFSDRTKKNVEKLQTCPFQGTGKFVIGKSKISAYSGDYRYSWMNKTDGTTKTFYVRGKGYASLLAKRSGKKVTFQSAAKYYSTKKYTNLAYNPKSAKIQVKKGSKWVTLKTVKFSKGKATTTATLKSSKAAQFRLTFPKTTTVTGSTSKVVKK
ncbi:hypothetical protein GCM10023166_17170 [Paeniglutamicibacter cryotolerans]